MPVYLRAVDSRVLEKAREKMPAQSLVDELLGVGHVSAVPDLSGEKSDEVATEFLIRADNRNAVLKQMVASTNPGVQQLLRCRTLTNTIIFSPVMSAAGQAFDTATVLTGLLLNDGYLNSNLSDAIIAAAAEAQEGKDSRAVEQMLLDILSLGRRFNWAQLVAFARRIETPATLHILTEQLRQDDDSAGLFAVVEQSAEPEGVARYLTTFSQSGMKDLQAGLRYGTGGVRHLLHANRRFYVGHFRPAFALDFCLHNPRTALTLKWGLYLASGFALALSIHFARRKLTGLEWPPQVRGVHIAREVLFALGFLLVVLLLSEPFLAQDSQKGDVAPFRLQLPGRGSTTLTGSSVNHGVIMNQLSLLTLLLFFVLQALLYVASLVKLAEIRRQKVAARIKLKLLDNEDHLFDAGLYLGFVGTIISLIFVSLGIIKPSLMAAYSSTSFGIIFVSVFKIFHLRPLRRKILLEAETLASLEPARSSPLAAPL